MTRPSGRQISHGSIGKYVSAVRAYLKRKLKRTFGRGAAASIIPDLLAPLLAGYCRDVEQPPKLEREGCTPSDLACGMAVCAGVTQMWRAALTFGMQALARGCEFALDAGHGEVFQRSEHMTPADVSRFAVGDGVQHMRIRMRKRKDLRVLRGKQSVVVLAGGGDGAFDAVQEMEAWLRERRAAGIPEDGPPFCHLDGSAITVSQVRDMVKAVMHAAGRDPRRYGAHSLRIRRWRHCGARGGG